MMKSIITEWRLMNIAVCLLFIVNVISCRSKLPFPGDNNGNDYFQETTIINQSNPAKALVGTYQAVQIDWSHSDLPGFKIEGSLTYNKVDTNFIKSQYYLQVETTPASDSIQLSFWGDGFGGLIRKRDLGRFMTTEVIPRIHSVNSLTNYTLDSWQFGTALDLHQINVSRFAYATKTELSFKMILCQLTDPSRAGQDNIVVNIRNQSAPSDKARTMQAWGEMTFTRTSTGILLDR